MGLRQGRETLIISRRPGGTHFLRLAPAAPALRDAFTALDPLVVTLAVFATFFAPAALGPPRPRVADFDTERTRPTTTKEPTAGVMVDSSPVDHPTRNSTPLAP